MSHHNLHLLIPETLYQQLVITSQQESVTISVLVRKALEDAYGSNLATEQARRSLVLEQIDHVKRHLS